MIQVDHKGSDFLLSFDDFDGDLKEVRELPVRVYDKKRKVWVVPQLAFFTIDHLECPWTPAAVEAGAAIRKALLNLVDYKFVEHQPDNKARNYQMTGIEWLKKAKKALLADDMGLGKSYQSLRAAIEIGGKVLVLCPASLKYNWRNEFRKHFDIEPQVVNGLKKKREQQWAEDQQYVIANYDLLLSDKDVMPKQWDVIIADEAVYLKTHKSQRTKLAKRLKSTYRFALSGIPMENNLLEFHSIFEWIRPELLTSPYLFKQKYCILDWAGNVVGYKNMAELHLVTSPFVLRRMKEDVLKDLPPKIYTDLPLEMSPAQARGYAAIVDEFLDWLRNETGKDWQNNILTKLIRLRQFVEFPELVGLNMPSGKLEMLRDVYQEAGKIVVFTSFKESVKLLEKSFKGAMVISGDVKSMEERFNIIEDFNQRDSGILLCTDAGKFGLNITGASTIVHYGYVYNPATIIQREDRLHRFGQQNTVNVIRPYFLNSIDEGIMSIFKRRLIAATEFMNESEVMSTTKLSKQDYMDIIWGVGVGD